MSRRRPWMIKIAFLLVAVLLLAAASSGPGAAAAPSNNQPPPPPPHVPTDDEKVWRADLLKVAGDAIDEADALAKKLANDPQHAADVADIQQLKTLTKDAKDALDNDGNNWNLKPLDDALGKLLDKLKPLRGFCSELAADCSKAIKAVKGDMCLAVKHGGLGIGLGVITSFIGYNFLPIWLPDKTDPAAKDQPQPGPVPSPQPGRKSGVWSRIKIGLIVLLILVIVFALAWICCGTIWGGEADDGQNKSKKPGDGDDSSKFSSHGLADGSVSDSTKSKKKKDKKQEEDKSATKKKEKSRRK